MNTPVQPEHIPFGPNPSGTPPKPEILLTEEQQHAVTLITTWMKDPTKREFKLGGYAGTGKTTVIKYLLKVLREDYTVSVAAFTGKAVSVLERKQINAQTLHSLMYDTEVQEDHSVVFTRKYQLECKPALVIVDEASMISTELYADLQYFKTKCLFVGDPGQLEPVGDNPNLMARPDLVLSKIHRQAESSPIIALATHVRRGGVIIRGGSDKEDLFIRDKSLSSNTFLAYTQVICATNKTRTLLNQRIRIVKKFPTNQIVVGEKIIVLRNNQGCAVFNGMILFVKSIRQDMHDHWVCDCEDETGKLIPYLSVWKKPYQDPSFDPKGYIPRRYVYTDYAYAITCHKSQGSEWESVIVIDEPMPAHIWDMKRWRYTAITRAAKRLLYCI